MGGSEPDRFGLIVGAMKCGTTSLFDLLSAHPEIAPCREKEPNFFCRDDFRPDDLAGYRSLWSWRRGEHKIALEASVNYSKLPAFPDCAERIAQVDGAEFRFVYCMRNPIDRIESHVHHGLYAGWTRPLDDGGVSEHTLAVSRYAMQLDAYAARFGRAAILLVVLEEFQQAPDATLRRVCEFLGVDPDFRFRDPESSRNRAADHYLEHPTWQRIRGLAPLRVLARAIPAPLRRALLRATGRRIEARRELSEAERSAIATQLQPDLQRLRSDYGIDAASTWGIELS